MGNGLLLHLQSSVPAWRETILTDTQQTEGYLPSIQPQHITTTSHL